MNAEAQQNPYAPPEAEVSDIVDGGQPLEHASRGLRLGGAVLDWLVWMVVAVPMVISAFSTGAWLANPEAMLSIFTSTGGYLTMAGWVAVVVITIVLVHRNGQTIGKKMVGIKVVRTDGTRASLGRIFWLRNVVNGIPQVIPFVGYIYMLVDHLFIFGDKRQCLHDKIADTIVVTA
jgi:uncharacterized RDD family membrane protein YckC